jgi:ClpX C4-type zinc finger
VSKSPSNAAFTCSFCGADSVRRIVGGPGVAICSECVAMCERILSEDEAMLELTAERSRSQVRHGELGHPLDDLPSDALLGGLAKRSQHLRAADEEIREAVLVLRRKGLSWARIGGALGISRQSAWERFSGED